MPNITKLQCLLAATCLMPFGSHALAQTPAAAETMIVSGIGGPEAPVLIGRDVYYVGWTDNILAKWDGHQAKVLHHDATCEHNGLAATADGHLLLACLADAGAIVKLTRDGKEIQRWKTDVAGRPLKGGVNDFAVTPNGGIYATISGPLSDPPGLIAGKVLYLAPGAHDWVEMADALNYANGLAVSPDGRTLYVAESIGNSITKFTIQANGTLSDRANFALLNVLVRDKIQSAFIGPDGIKVDRAGNLYVAQFNGGKVIKISPTGKLIHVFEIAAGDGVTNVALSPDERALYVTTVRDPSDPKATGSLIRMPNLTAP
ncbi:SMP-30/gluconolactonase/LRE family protein [Sphingobium boeckii]|uniref:Gluconolactonase n=1 Tax=Sphingobium boeckii TaxID=1082345 RepID=A0A7W9AHR5_9SPHN|nr:SMP-30/gluconolactonase/LRE family protein [Sphingobium boeckii]MBB5685689.1 gluconolactonase [Sphingobium boeckii]